MVQQETGGSGTGEPSLTEEVQAQSEAEDTGTEAPALNRAERRAQAKGKKAGANNGVRGLPAHGALGANQRSTGAVVPIRVNRTGSRSK